MTSTITCKCGQEYPLERGACPYCRATPELYWFLDKSGITRNAMVVPVDGKLTLFVDSEAQENPMPGLPEELLEKLVPPTGIRKFLKGYRNLRERLRISLYSKRYKEWLSPQDEVSKFELGSDFEDILSDNEDYKT